jgi:8-oxo-dGTP pyrophosphatase MutT (NUDIX family)
MEKTIKKSYGILCTRYNLKTDKIEFLLVQRRCTFFYTEFLFRNSYKNNDNILMYLLNNMTHEEKMDILSMDFGQMWYRVWFINPESPYIPDNLKLPKDRYDKYLICKNNFYKNFMIDGGKKLKTMISKSQNAGSLWEIPKGRKCNPQEKELNCAIREFEEETNIRRDEYRILDEDPITTIVTSMNVKYISEYYIALLLEPYDKLNLQKFKYPKLDYDNHLQISEVADLVWMDIDKIKVIGNNDRLLQIAKSINKMLRKKYKIKKLFTSFFIKN